MNDEQAARQLVVAAREIAGKGKVPEAFKKQWKKNDKGKSDKEKDNDKPDFLKKKKSSKSRSARYGSRELADAKWAVHYLAQEYGDRVVDTATVLEFMDNRPNLSGRDAEKFVKDAVDEYNSEFDPQVRFKR